MAVLALLVTGLVGLTPNRANAQADPQPDSQAVEGLARGFEIAPRGYVQFDWRGYPDWTVTTGTGRVNRDSLEVRRLRVGVDGRWRRTSFELTVDPQDGDGVFVKDAYARIRFTRALRLQVGQFKLPGSREYQVAARSLDFMERAALAQSAAAGRDVGAMLTGSLGRAFEYQAGLFLGDGNGRASRAERTSAARVVWTLPHSIELGGTFSEGRTKAVDSDPANGLEGRSAAGYRFFDRVYVRGRRMRVGIDAEWSHGPWRATAEALRASDQRREQGLDYEDLPDVVGTGWSVAVSRAFGRRRAEARSRIREFDLGLRYDQLSFDDNGPETLDDSVRARAVDIRARAARTLTASTSWNFTRWTRLIANAALERYSEARTAPEPGREGNYWAVALRLQLRLP